MTNNRNIHGLSRRVPSGIRDYLRKEGGYGCVFCGNPFIQYEHIEPNFSDAIEHDPEKMTILCSYCHDKVTQGRRSKSKVWDAKKNPIAKRNGFVREVLEPATSGQKFQLGGCTFELNSIVLSIYSKPIIWFEHSNNPDEPILLNAIFYDENSTPLAFINRNEFIGIVGDADIKCIKSRIELRTTPRHISLVLVSDGDKPILINRLNLSMNGFSIKVIDSRIEISNGKHLQTFEKLHASNALCAIGLGDALTTRHYLFGKLKKLQIAQRLASKLTIPLKSYNGESLGWYLYGFLVNHKYEFTATVNNKFHVYSGHNDFIGNLIILTNDKSEKYAMLTYHSNSYDSGEPIWIDKNNINTRLCQFNDTYDLGYRLGVNNKCYTTP